MASRAPIDVQLGGPIFSTSDDVAAVAPTPETGFLDNLKASRDEMLLVGNTDARARALRGAYEPLLSALDDVGADGLGEQTIYSGRRVRTHMVNPYDLAEDGGGFAYGLVMPSRREMRDAIFARIRERRKLDKNFLPGVPDTADAYEQQVNQRDAARLQQIRQVQAGATGWGQVGGFAGGVLGSFQDPVNLATMPFGGGAKTLVGSVARSAVENMLVETISQPFVRQNYAAIGEDMTLGDSVRQVLFAGGLGGAFGGAGHVVRHLGPAYDSLAAKVFEAMPESVRERWAKSATIDDRLLADTFRAAVPEASWTGEMRDAVNVLERDAEVREASPFTASPQGDDAHASALELAMQQMVDRGRSSLRSSTSPIAAATGARSAGPALSRDDIIRFTMHDLEGGAAVVNYSQADGGTTKYGIAAKFNRGVDVANLTDAQASEIYRRDYWFAGLDQAPPATAAVAFDAGVIAGPNVGKRILAASGGDVERAIALYRAHLNHIADTVPGKAKYRKGWNARVDKLARKLGAAGDGLAEATPEWAGLGEARGAEEIEAEQLALGREADRAADAELGRAADEPRPIEPAPELKRELFDSDDAWLEAQVRVWRDQEGEMPPAAAVEGPPARETPSGPPEVAPEGGAGAARPPGAAEPVTPETFVDAYIRGEGRGDTPRDRELQEFQLDNGPAIEAEFQRRAEATNPARPLSRDDIEAMRPADARRDPLWLAGLNAVQARELGREPEGVWAIRDRETGEIASWMVKRKDLDRELANQWDPARFDVERLAPENVAIELRARAARAAAEASAGDLSPALEGFSEPNGEGAKAQAESLEHDARMEVAAAIAGEQLVARNRERPRTTGLKGAAAKPIATFRQDPAQVRKKGQRKRNYYLGVTEHADHKAAKAGDLDAAERLVDDLVQPEQLRRAGAELKGATFVPVIAEEASGRNTIPITLAERYAAAAGGMVDTAIVQAERAFHTGASPAERIVRRARFDGPVTPGQRYVLVDDVAAMGGSIAELADHIQRGGGTVERIVLLASGVDDFAPTPKQIRAIEDGGYADHFRNFAGIEPQALTRAEAEWALGRSPDRVRDQLAAAVGRRDGGRARAAPSSAEGQGGLDQPGGAEGVAESPQTYRTDEEGPERTLGQILDDADRERSAWEALKACLTPKAGGQ